MKTNVVSQKEAVFKAVAKHCKGKKLSDDAKTRIYAQLESDFLAGKINLKPTEGNLMKLADERLLRNYIVGLVSNWLAKDERLAKIA